jgi:hypothetical protein
MFDDVALIARTKKALIELFNNLRAGAELVGLYINEDKIKYVHIKGTDQRNTPLRINNFPFEKVCNFTYLGSLVNESNLIQPEISERICKGNRAYYANAKLLSSKLLKRSTKMKIYLNLIRPVVTYSSEMWTLNEHDKNWLRIFRKAGLKKNIWPTMNQGKYLENTK